MSYSVKGWNVFNFIITPEELRTILKPYHLVIDNAHVSLDYSESPIEEYIDMYRELFERLSNGEKLLWKQHNHLMEHRGVTSDMSICKFGKVHKYEGLNYKMPMFEEPLVDLIPYTFSVFKDSKGKLNISTSCSYTLNPELIVGVGIYYPKAIIREGEEEFVNSHGLNGSIDFHDIKKSIMAITKPLTIIKDGEVKRTNLHVSSEVKDCLRNFYAIKCNEIEIK